MLLFILDALESDADKRKLVEIYDQYQLWMEKTAMGILKNQKDAEDAVQNAWIQIIRHFEKISEIPCKKLPAWIITIVKNEARMILRKKKRDLPSEDWGAVAAQGEQVSDYKELVALFSRLPETYRAALEMKFLLDYPNKEIARRLGLSEEAVNTRISRGRALLQEILEKEGFHP